MPRMSRQTAPGSAEQQILCHTGRDALITGVLVVVTACVFAAVGDHRMLASIHRLDDTWPWLMISGRASSLTTVATVFQRPRARTSRPGADRDRQCHQRVRIQTPLTRLALQRWWWHLAALRPPLFVSLSPGRA